MAAFHEPFVMELRCELTKEEHIRKSEALAEGVAEIAALEERKAALAKRCKEEIDEQRRRNHALAYDVRSGSELRPVECYESPRFEEMQVDIIRADIRRDDPRCVVKSRNMAPHEKQLSMPMEALTPEEAETEPPTAVAVDSEDEPTKH